MSGYKITEEEEKVFSRGKFCAATHDDIIISA